MMKPLMTDIMTTNPGAVFSPLTLIPTPFRFTLKTVSFLLTNMMFATKRDYCISI